MDAGNEQKNSMSNRTNSQQKGWNPKFLERKKQALQEEKDKRKKQQQLIENQVKKTYLPQINISPNNDQSLPILSQSYKHPLNFKQSSPQNRIEPESYPKPLTSEQILAQGKILKIIEKTLTHDQFKVQCLYEDEIIELIASKQQIVKNNIIPLLDFYQKTLGLR